MIARTCAWPRRVSSPVSPAPTSSFRARSSEPASRLAKFAARCVQSTEQNWSIAGSAPKRADGARRPAKNCSLNRLTRVMSVQVYGCNHVAIEVDDVEKAVAFYQDVFNLKKLDEGEGDAFFQLGAHQFLAMFKVDDLKPDRMRHFGIMVRDEAQLAEVREKIT